MNEQELINQLNAPEKPKRLAALRKLKELRVAGHLPNPTRGHDVNNHIHTFYSFSPFSPSKAIWMADQAGLSTAGIMDHDSISGAREFAEAGRIMNLPTTIGAECRVSFAGTLLEGRRINNPDQDTIACVALHGVPHNQIDALTAFFEPIRQARALRNRQMTSRLNDLLKSSDIQLDYDRDIVPLSAWADGGEVTERHLLYALAAKLLKRFGLGSRIVDFLRYVENIPVSVLAIQQLSDPDNPYLPFDLVNVLKNGMIDRFYIDAYEECPPINDVASFAREHGIILAYAYRGDVTDSGISDKKARKFEDAYLNGLFEVLSQNGFNAVTYMPSRNTRQQLIRLRSLCDKYDLFQISGEDINQPRQPFICKAMREKFFANLYDNTWALIGHERLATADLDRGMFTPATSITLPDLAERIEYFQAKAKALYPKTEFTERRIENERRKHSSGL